MAEAEIVPEHGSETGTSAIEASACCPSEDASGRGPHPPKDLEVGGGVLRLGVSPVLGRAGPVQPPPPLRKRAAHMVQDPKWEAGWGNLAIRLATKLARRHLEPSAAENGARRNDTEQS